ncbi:serine/threonine protein phosphatase [Listeria monocytogenes]|nr:serine/threonine protein phosphatase [Listeria monocytogenes]
MKPIFAVGDVNGEITLLDELLENWDKEQERLLFVGDLIDRGENPAAVLRRVKALADQTGAIVLKGNHEQMLLDFLENPSGKMHYYLSQGGMETIQSLIADSLDKKMTPEGLAERVKEEAAELIDFIRNLPLYYEEGKYVFVHAGVDLTKKDWHDTEERDFFWIREPFLFGQNKTGKVFIFGHTPVQNLHIDESSGIWVSEDKTRLDIDGGAVFGGELHGVVVEEKVITKSFSVKK